MSSLAQPPQAVRPPGDIPPPGDRYHYGWRQISRQRQDGSWYLESIPLTLDDMLHPARSGEIGAPVTIRFASEGERPASFAVSTERSRDLRFVRAKIEVDAR